MNRNKLVSIIMPTYNRAYILSQAIKSVLKQTYKNIELIIVDDRSTDGTERKVKTFEDARIQYIRQDENRGPSACRNVGIRASKGEFVSFLDSDDEYFPEKIERNLNVFRTSANHLGMVASNHVRIFNSEKRIGHPEVNDVGRIFPHLSSWMIRKTVFEDIGFFDERITISEDVDFFERFRKKFAHYFIKEPLLNVYVSKDGFFFEKKKSMRLREECVKNLQGDKRLYAYHLKYLAKDLVAIGKVAEARECYWKAFCAYPLNINYFIKYIKSYFPNP